ncbi:MAG: tRNA 2-thiocytidine(32) synthetase TtcA [Clostridia bacterium]|nr:tRNA 2-thiocytidine(32) synthetase TtcA [Clostridia bacterium]
MTFDLREIQRILSTTRRAVEQYHMIEEGDRIAVGVSAGKDSLTLLCALAELRRFLPDSFELYAITIDMGFKEGFDLSGVEALCTQLAIPYRVVKTEIAEIIFDVRKEPNPCSICARMRRGALHDAAKELGCNKLALGHHYDDVVETFMLNLFFEGRIGCFQPVTYLSRKDLIMIRPLIYTEEKEITRFARRAVLPVCKSPCPADKHTERERMKDYLAIFDREHPGLYNRIAGAIARGGVDGFEEYSKDKIVKKRTKTTTAEENSADVEKGGVPK